MLLLGGRQRDHFERRAGKVFAHGRSFKPVEHVPRSFVEAERLAIGRIVFQPLFDLLAGRRIELAVEISDQFVVVGVFHERLPVALRPACHEFFRYGSSASRRLSCARANSDLMACGLICIVSAMSL